MSFQKAERKQVKVKIGLIGPSGAGKSYSALRLATGIGGPIAYIDTEDRRSEYYANEFDYDVMHLSAPYTPEKYIHAIREAKAAGYNVLIIDSASHEWSGTGGLLEEHSKMPGNSYTNWAKITPRHNAFINEITSAPMHVIVTMRGKDEYVMEETSNGKQAPKKVGKGAQQRDGFEYELTCSFMIDQKTHVADVMKDNTHLFEGRYDVLTEAHGKAILEWASIGNVRIDPPKAAEPAPVSERPAPQPVADEQTEQTGDISAIREEAKNIIKSPEFSQDERSAFYKDLGNMKSITQMVAYRNTWKKRLEEKQKNAA